MNTEKAILLLTNYGFKRMKSTKNASIRFGKVLKANGRFATYKNDLYVGAGESLVIVKNPVVTFRIELNNKEIVLYFVTKKVVKKKTLIVKIGSERRITFFEDLEQALQSCQYQLREVDEQCNKCDVGIYHWKSDFGTCYGKCNRCAGLGWQNYNLRHKNIGYDKHVQRMAKSADFNYVNCIPHWTPDLRNLK